MAKNKFSKLQIDTSKIEGWIKLWCEETLEGEFSIKCLNKSDRIQYEILNLGKSIKIELIKAAGGLFTIHYKLGTQIELSNQLAEALFKRVTDVTTSSPFNSGFSVILSGDEFETIIALLSDREDISLEDYREETRPGVANYKQYRFRGYAGDKIVIKYFTNTSRMQIQGKPLFVFTEAVSYVSEFAPDKDELVDASIKYCDLGITKEESYEELEAILGTKLFKFLPRSHKALLATAFNLRKVEFETDDYSYLLTNVCRTYEGYIKKIFAQKGLECEGEQQLGKFFEWPDHISPVMINDYTYGLDEEIVKKFTAMFKVFCEYRHPFMHASGYDVTTTIIANRAIAIEKFNEMISSMISWHEWAVDNIL